MTKKKDREIDDLTASLGDAHREIERLLAVERYAHWMEEKMLNTLMDHAEAQRLLLGTMGVNLRNNE